MQQIARRNKDVGLLSAYGYFKGVTIRDSDNHFIDSNTNMSAVIEVHVWIGINTTILKGATIGKDAVIATGAVFTKDVPSKCLAGGVPAKVIRKSV
ncbi:hypothetical protein [Paraglaciecola sp. MB-3u-78]|uniref:hypothetical protein n=1 Tax=Paraglaciecola sp. MB-3u-78 TaxID=2058332 RepID=UPI000C3498B5|nr:hypothetical protein [Paraglaciecola sp. MB-3u-78]PKG98757.1 hypothetical protein CXF95_12920 [Paraglaciecola sp. MB-3u-78]